MQSGAHVATYTYRYGHKLAALTSTFPDEASTVWWVTDGLGKRRMSWVNGGSGRHWWRWAGMAPIAEYEDTEADAFPTTKSIGYVPGLAERVGLAGAYRYYSTDFYGSVRRTRDDAMASLGTYEFEPYGTPFYNSGLAINFGYTGHQWDSNVGMYYTAFRYYSPTAARWISREPFGIDGPNLYWYGRNNPASYVDPNGLSSRSLFGGHKGDWIDQGLDWGGRIGAIVGVTAAIGAIGIVAVAPAAAFAEVTAGTTGVVGSILTGFTRHGINQVISRDGGNGVCNAALLDALRNPQRIIQNGGVTQYVGQNVSVVLNSAGKVITCYPLHKSGCK